MTPPGPSPSPPPPPGDQARVSVRVEVPQEAAFRLFTKEIDRWWRRGLKYRVAGTDRGIIHLEPWVGGRLFESFQVGAETKIFDTGKVTLWQPPSRLRFEWRAVPFTAEEKTDVDVSFEATGGATLVTVTHRGWSSIRPDHPVRHGQPVPAFIRMMGMWWGELMRSMREYAASGQRRD